MRSDLVQILSRVFNVAPDTIDEGASPDSIKAWDSLGHLELIAALESRFDRRFQLREIQAMDSLAAIENVLGVHQT